jgi:hypothetical protein
LAKDRTDLALSWMYADILRDLSHLEGRIKTSRIENDVALDALEVLEQDIADSLNSFLFFKQLYSTAPPRPAAKDATSTPATLLAVSAGIVGVMVLLRGLFAQAH